MRYLLASSRGRLYNDICGSGHQNKLPRCVFTACRDRHRSARALHRARSQQETHCRGIFMVTVTVGPLPSFAVARPVIWHELVPGTDLISCGGYCWCTHAPCLRSVRLGSFYWLHGHGDCRAGAGPNRPKKRDCLVQSTSFVHKLIGAGGVLISGIIISMVGFDDPLLDKTALYGAAPLLNSAGSMS